MKPSAVLDSSLVVSGIGWSTGSSRLVLVALAKRRFISVLTPWLGAEWGEVVHRVSIARHWRNPNWMNWLEWVRRASKLIADPPVRPTVRRDPKDDPVVAAAVAGQVQYLVSNDNDLLDLGKPYGIACVTPQYFMGVLVRA